MKLETFENEIEYKFKKIELLKTAFTHTSYANEKKIESNEREFQESRRFKEATLGDIARIKRK